MRKIKKWKDFYLFIYDVKTTGCIYFVAFVFFYLVYGFIDPGNATTLDSWTCMQFIIACFLIGLGQGLIIPKNDISVPRILLWGLLSMLITVGFSEGFRWFNSYPRWYSLIFYSVIAISFIFMWLAFYWRLQRETKVLNDALNKFKEINKA